MMVLNPEAIKRFTEKFHKGEQNDCWNWLAGKVRDGYGFFSVNGNLHKAHRVSWVIYRGDIPEGMSVLHHCDNRACINPNHLYLGTHQDNMRDMVRRGRSLSGDKNPSHLHPDRRARGLAITKNRKNTVGERNANSKLTWDSVREIRALYGSGNITQVQLSKKYNVAQTVISKIVIGQAWKEANR